MAKMKFYSGVISVIKALNQLTDFIRRKNICVGFDLVKRFLKRCSRGKRDGYSIVGLKKFTVLACVLS